MTQVDRVKMHFSGGDEAPELEDYRPISPLVMVACIAGLMSLLAIVHPLLWIVPVVAVILSVCAIRQLSTAQSRYGGRPGAVVALCLAALIGTYAPARSISRERALYMRAQTQAKRWISIFQQGRYLEAHQLTMEPSQRFQGPGPLADHYLPPDRAARSDASSMDDTMMDPDHMLMNPSATAKLASFLQEPVLAKLVAYGEQSSVAHVRNVSVGATYDNVVVTQRFRVSGVQDGQPGSIEFLVKSIRWEALEHANWQFGGFREVE